jgi:hypothetical protein
MQRICTYLLTWLIASSFVLAENPPLPKPQDPMHNKTKKVLDQGRNICIWANGDMYEGELKDGKMDDYGIYRWSDGDIYQGYFRGSKQSMDGAAYYAESNNVYEGMWRDGKREGRGVLRWGNGDIYEG